MPLLAGVVFWIALPAGHAILVARQQNPRLVADNRVANSRLEVAQSEEAAEEAEVPPEQVEKYINAYKAMQRNHALTIDEAANQQGLSVQQFRDIEGKIERDDMLREHVRQVLSKSAKSSAQ
jgi:hypothetical protein